MRGALGEPSGRSCHDPPPLAEAVVRAALIDDGRSFEHSAKLQGGAFVEFTMSSGFCINPFSMIDPALAEADEDYRMDCFAMLKSIVNQMARHIDKLNDTELAMPNLPIYLIEGRPM